VSRDHYREFIDQLNIGYEEEHLKMIQTLNVKQRARFSLIMNRVGKKIGQIFFVDGLGGTGKTYLCKALLAKVRSMNLITIATASFGIAASIMPARAHYTLPLQDSHQAR